MLAGLKELARPPSGWGAGLVWLQAIAAFLHANCNNSFSLVAAMHACVVNKGPARLQARPFNLREIKVIRDLNPEDIGRLICIDGMVTRCSSVIPRYGVRHCCTSVHTEAMLSFCTTYACSSICP